MKADEAKKITDHALDQLAEALKAGKSEQLTRCLATMARFHRYSFGNILLILAQRPEASHVAGFHAWRQMGRFVKKGEKGIAIIAPMAIRPRDDEAAPDGGNQNAPRPILRFRAVYVFDIAQTDGEPLPEIANIQGDPGDATARLRAHIAAQGITIDNEDLPAGADGVSRGGRISIRSGLVRAQEFSVLVHEFAHELLHRGQDRPASKTVRETEAEAVAFVVSAAIGLNPGTASSDYIQLYQGDAKTLAASLDRIQHTAAFIIAGLTADEAHDQIAA